MALAAAHRCLQHAVVGLDTAIATLATKTSVAVGKLRRNFCPNFEPWVDVFTDISYNCVHLFQASDPTTINVQKRKNPENGVSDVPEFKISRGRTPPSP